jgi:hypothetical protein
MIRLVADGQVDLRSIITHRFPLESAAAAYELIRDRSQGAIKAVLQVAEQDGLPPVRPVLDEGRQDSQGG